ncbi:MAG: GNAT family N-acetyltransferase [Pseudomonadota bacterium]|nr:GNAT family N-acetyltransferase [Pseudomonadota bacterium]
MTTALTLHIARQPADINPAAWDALLACQAQPTPFMQHAFLAALHASGSAVPETGWAPCFALLRQGSELVAACPLYVKNHSWGEYVFDWAWARAYGDHGLPYYPKAVVAVPFSPVPGSRLLARDAPTRAALAQALVQWSQAQQLSSLHVLFGDDADQAACAQAGLMARNQVQFHWHNAHPGDGRGFDSFEAFLASLNQEKRKKIRQERRRVAEAGVRFRWLRGADIRAQDWAFFYRCHERTYLEHGHHPYLAPAFFAHMARDMAAHWVLFMAEREGHPLACSLIAVDDNSPQPVAWGRYWGALERVDCLHFEACYYQPIEWCIAHGITGFEGGAQGEHKMARALMPARTHSAHWLAHPAFASAVEDFLAREDKGVQGYLAHLQARSPFRQAS